MTKTTKFDTAETIYRGQLKEQVKRLREKGFKPSCVKKIDLRSSTKTLEAIFKEGLLILLNLTEVTVDPDVNVYVNDIYDKSGSYVTLEYMKSFKASKYPITKSLWWVISYMTNPYFMHTMYRQWDPNKKEYIYDTHSFKHDLPITEYQVKRANVYPSSHKQYDDCIKTNIDEIPAKKINDYKGLEQYVKNADGRNKRLFAKQLFNLTGVRFDIIHDYKLMSFNDTNDLPVNHDNVNYGLNIYAVCSAA